MRVRELLKQVPGLRVVCRAHRYFKVPILRTLLKADAIFGELVIDQLVLLLKLEHLPLLVYGGRWPKLFLFLDYERLVFPNNWSHSFS